MKQIEQARVDVVDIAGAKVTQEAIDGGERVLQVRPAAEVLDGKSFTGMGVRETQRAVGDGCEQPPRCAHDGHRRRERSDEVTTGHHGVA